VFGGSITLDPHEDGLDVFKVVLLEVLAICAVLVRSDDLEQGLGGWLIARLADLSVVLFVDDVRLSEAGDLLGERERKVGRDDLRAAVS
jgi:hypothetical protein